MCAYALHTVHGKLLQLLHDNYVAACKLWLKSRLSKSRTGTACAWRGSAIRTCCCAAHSSQNLSKICWPLSPGARA